MRIWTGILVMAVAGLALAQDSKPKLAVSGAHDKGLTSGSDLYKEYCAVCHGKDGKGGGPAAAALKSKPADLTQLTKTHEGKFPVGQVRKLLGGGSSTPAHGSQEMPIWGPVFRSMSPNQSIATLRVDNLMHYLESIQEK